MGVHLGKVTASYYFEVNPDDTELLKFSKSYHQAQIESLQGRNEGSGQTTTTKRGQGKTNNLATLTASLVQVVQENGSATEIQEKLFEHMVSKD